MTVIAGTQLVSLWAEVTGKCQLSCVHCYAGSGPEGTHGTMTVGQWKTVLTDAAALGTRAVCFIGGEPTMYPDLPELVRHALSEGMEVEVYTNLVFVSRKMWELFELPGVRVATSWYSSDREEHKQVTGRDTWRQTLANIEEVTRRGIRLRVGIIDGIVPGQHVQEGAALLRERGVTNVGSDYLREFGRGTTCDPGQACGNCGQGRAAILPDGTVTPCPLTRWMDAGNVADVSLAAILPTVTELADTIPAVQRRKCEPSDCAPEVGCSPTFCSPACGPTHAQDKCVPHECGPDVCKPMTDNCRPDTLAVMSGCSPHTCTPFCGPTTVMEVCNPDDCRPDMFCAPLCSPSACRPNIRAEVQVQVQVDAPCYPDDCRPDTFCRPLCTPSECRPNLQCRPETKG